MKNDSFVFYRSFYQASLMLNPEEYKEAMMGIFLYVFENEEPEFKHTTAEIIFTLVKPQIDANVKRKQNGALGGRPTDEEDKKPSVIEKENHRLSDEKPNVNVNDNVNVNVNKKESVKKSPAFQPPTIEEVRTYISEMGYDFDPERFIDFYASKGWLVGKTKMKDWKAAVRNWGRQDKKEQKGARQNPKIHNCNERQYDYGSMLQEMIGK